MGLSALPGLGWLIHFPCYGSFNYNLQIFSQSLLFFWDFYYLNVSVFKISQKSLRLPSWLFIFSFFYFVAIISIILTSNSLIHSTALVIVLLISSSLLFSSVIVLLIAVCLFFSFSRSLLKIAFIFLSHVFFSISEIMDHLYYNYSEFFLR